MAMAKRMMYAPDIIRLRGVADPNCRASTAVFDHTRDNELQEIYRNQGKKTRRHPQGIAPEIGTNEADCTPGAILRNLLLPPQIGSVVVSVIGYRL